MPPLYPKASRQYGLRSLFAIVAAIAVACLLAGSCWGQLTLAVSISGLAMWTATRGMQPLARGLACFASFLIAIPILFAAFSYWTMQMPAVPESKLAQMRIGMSRDEVRRLLGSPRYDKGDLWIYQRMTWAHLNVLFDGDGKVRHFEHDF